MKEPSVTSGRLIVWSQAPWGYNINIAGDTKGDDGLFGNGPFTNLPIVWAFEYGARENVSEIKEKWWPLIKGEAEFASCFLSPLPNASQVSQVHPCMTVDHLIYLSIYLCLFEYLQSTLSTVFSTTSDS